jgi:aminoglycoside phosphotransferase (APT) family kinase protein
MMAITPAADVDTSPGLVRQLLRAQHPELAELDVRLVANGWDNTIYRLGDDLAVRLPRRELAASLITNEQRWLPEIAGRVAVAVPRPLRIGRPGSGFPWHWSISTWFDGTVAASVPRRERAGLAEPLARFLGDLQTPAPADAPVNQFRGVPLADRDSDVRARLASGRVPQPARLAALWNDAVAAPPWTSPPLWLHGDLHPANLLTASGDLSAVLDFGDLTSGDPATDLAAAWLIFDGNGRERFRSTVDSSRAVSDATWLRARGWALCMATALATNSDDAPDFQLMGEEIITEVLSD